jgi:glutaredoxin 3
MAAAEVVVYTTDWCPYCRAAEALLRSKGVDYRRVDVSGNHEIRRWLVEATGRRTVPQVFINGAPVGGFDDINALDRSGRLDPMLATTPPIL